MLNEGKVLVQAMISEKATTLQEKQNCYMFKVAIDANKPQIKHAVEKAFNVKVTNVSVARVKGKTKRLGRFQGKRSDWKKAFVWLKEGDGIELFETV
ncbi:MAG: 50S ribosomal protein L23 [candidate division Zixibacteria bacterium]